MIIVTGTVDFGEGDLEVSQAMMDHVIAQTRKEPGCQYYSYSLDITTANRVTVLEYWDDWAALDAHFQTPHIAQWRAHLGAIGLRNYAVRFFEAGEERHYGPEASK